MVSSIPFSYGHIWYERKEREQDVFMHASILYIRRSDVFEFFLSIVSLVFGLLFFIVTL